MSRATKSRRPSEPGICQPRGHGKHRSSGPAVQRPARSSRKGMKGRAATKAFLLRPRRRRLRRGLPLWRLRSAGLVSVSNGQQRGQANAAAAKKPSAAGAADQGAARDIFVRSQNPTGSAVTYNQNYADSRSDQWQVRSMKYSARIVRNGTTRVGIGRVTTGRADRWRLLLLEQRLLVSGLGL